MSRRSKPTPKQLASAVWHAQGLVMNGGVLHAVETLQPAELDAAIDGYIQLAYAAAAEVLSTARAMPDSAKEAEEADLNRAYDVAVPDAALLETALDALSGLKKSRVYVGAASDSTLIEMYRAAASEYGRASARGDYRTANRAHDRLASAYRTLRARGPESQAKLVPLTRDSDSGVRAWAAAHALEFSPAAGEPVLVDIAAQPGPFGFSARMTLQEWRAGRLRFP